MEEYRKYYLAENFPATLLPTALSLQPIGVDNLAWKFNETLDVIHYLQENEYTLFHVKMYGVDREEIFVLDEDWNMAMDIAGWDYFRRESFDRSIYHIKNCYASYGDRYFYALVPIKELEFQIRQVLPAYFPRDLLLRAIPLVYDSSDVSEVVWKYQDAMKAIGYFANHNSAILGGDVYTMNEDGVLISDGSGWYTDRKLLGWEEYVEKSKQESLSYIEYFSRSNGEEGFYYALVVSTK